jgi:methylaspartate mutase sigma subunit
MNGPTILLGVIGADCHSVGNKILDAFFTEKGFTVVNLGVMVSQDEFIDAALETGAAAILVSSLYGHGEIDCIGFRDRCVERGLEDVLLYVGGNLAMGFDRVFLPSDDLEEAARLLAEDTRAGRDGHA